MLNVVLVRVHATTPSHPLLWDMRGSLQTVSHSARGSDWKGKRVSVSLPGPPPGSGRVNLPTSTGIPTEFMHYGCQYHGIPARTPITIDFARYVLVALTTNGRRSAHARTARRAHRTRGGAGHERQTGDV